MANRFYTFIIVPNASSRLQKIRIPAVAVNGLAAVGIVSLLVSTVLGFSYMKMANYVADYQKLVVENTELKVLNKNLEVTARKLSTKISDLEIISDRLTNLIESEGLARRLSKLPGVGGSKEDLSTSKLLSGISLRENMNLLRDQTAELETQMKSLELLAEQRVSLLRSIPSAWPVRGAVSSGFGPRRDPFDGTSEFHMGMDIPALYGSSVRATADGVVIFASRQSAYGNLLVLSHGNGVTTRHGHLSRFAVRPGQRVRRGDVVAYVGNTGRATSAHLHYEVRLNDRPLNPRRYLP